MADERIPLADRIRAELDRRNQVRAGFFSNLLRGVFRLKDQETLGVLRDILPVVDLFNLPFDHYFWAGWKKIDFGQLVPAVAAENGYIGLSIPSTASVIAVVEFYVADNTANPYQLRLRNTDATRTLDQGVVSTDTRWGSTEVSTSHVIVGTEPGLSGANVGRFLNPPSMAPIPHRVYLTPGQNVVLGNETVNVAFSAGFKAYERVATADEIAEFKS